MEPRVGIVLVNYNGEKFQNDCIRTIKDMTYNNYEIIVVDNNSKDNSVKMLKEEFPNVIIIETGENCGVAKGNNIGIKCALENGCEYVLLLNNDTEVENTLLTYLMDKADENTLVVPKMYYYEPNDLIWFAGGRINWNKGLTEHFGIKEKDRGQYDQEKVIEYAPTCCMLIHKSVFGKVGLMDEEYFMYFDDTDFCERVSRKNYRILYVPKAVLWHKVSSSSGGEDSPTFVYYMNRNRLYFIRKFKGNVTFSFIYTIFTRYIKIINWYLRGNKKLAKLAFNAMNDYFQGNMGRLN